MEVWEVAASGAVEEGMEAMKEGPAVVWTVLEDGAVGPGGARCQAVE